MAYQFQNSNSRNYEKRIFCYRATCKQHAFEISEQYLHFDCEIVKKNEVMTSLFDTQFSAFLTVAYKNK